MKVDSTMEGEFVLPNKLKIYVNNMMYAITAQDDTAYVKGLAEEIDECVRNVIHASKASMNEALVLTALYYIDEQKKAEANADHLRTQITEYAAEAGKARQEIAELKREIERLERISSEKKDRKR